MKKPERLPFEEFKQIYSKVPRLTVEAILIKDGKVLLTKRAIEPETGKWHTPGGTILLGESPEETAVRTAREELGVETKITKFLGYIEYKSFKTFGQDISLCFAMEQIDDTEIKLDKGASEYDYFDEIPENTIVEQAEFLKDKIALFML